MKKTFVFVVLLSALFLMFAMVASAGPAMDRIIKKGELVVGTSGAQPPMTATTKKGNADFIVEIPFHSCWVSRRSLEDGLSSWIL